MNEKPWKETRHELLLACRTVKIPNSVNKNGFQQND